MMTSPNTDGYFQPPHPDVQLIKRTNYILKLMEQYESHYEMLLVESQLICAKAAFLDACIKEANDNRYNSDEKIKARNLVESAIESFEKLYEEITRK